MALKPKVSPVKLKPQAAVRPHAFSGSLCFHNGEWIHHTRNGWTTPKLKNEEAARAYASKHNLRYIP